MSDKPEPAEATEAEALATLLERGSDHHGADCDRAAAMLRALAARLAAAEEQIKALTRDIAERAQQKRKFFVTIEAMKRWAETAESDMVAAEQRAEALAKDAERQQFFVRYLLPSEVCEIFAGRDPSDCFVAEINGVIDAALGAKGEPK